MYILPWESDDIKEAKENYNTYNKMMNKIERKLSVIAGKLEDIENSIDKEKQSMFSYDDAAEGKFKIIYDGMCGRHSDRLRIIYEHFSEAYDVLAAKCEECEEECSYWNRRIEELDSEM